MGLEVDVQGGVSAGPEGPFHGHTVGVCGPGRVDGQGWGGDGLEGYARRCVGGVEDCKLRRGNGQLESTARRDRSGGRGAKDGGYGARGVGLT